MAGDEVLDTEKVRNAQAYTTRSLLHAEGLMLVWLDFPNSILNFPTPSLSCSLSFSLSFVQLCT